MTPLRKSILAKFASHHGGATAVEFAMVASAFVTVVMGICYVGIMLFNNLSLDWAVQRAARQLTLDHAVTQVALTATINNYLSSVGLSNANVEYAVATSNTVQTGFIVAHYNQTYVLPFVSTFNMTFSSSASVPLGS